MKNASEYMKDSIYGYITNSQRDELSVGLIAPSDYFYFLEIILLPLLLAFFALPFRLKAYSINLPASVNQPTGKSSDES